MEHLAGVVRHYAWGSTTMLAGLRGEPASSEPEAELWFGTHPNGPSTLPDHAGATLLSTVAGSPLDQLGPDVVDRFGAQLPFLLKLLAADAPLSLQAHPSKEQARAGFAAEEAAGVDRSAPNRSFPDENHKPELIAAVTPFEALVGFRDATKTATFLVELGLSEAPGFRWLRTALLNDGPRAAFSAIVEPRGSGLDELDLTEMSVSLGEASGVYDGAWAAEAQLLERLDRSHTGAPGVVAAALLNRVLLEPGEALFLDAGVLHAYIGGLAVEVMANSDNVLRGGLTNKHIDVSNLLDVLRPETVDPEPLIVDTSGRYRTSSSEFVLSRLEKPRRREVGGPAIVVAVYEDAMARNGSRQIRLAPTGAVWLAHGERAEISSDGLVFAATVGPSTTLDPG